MIYLQLLLSFMQIGLFSIGGGYAALPLIQQQVVDLHGWLTLSEFSDVVAISQMTPGPIAINAATFVGMRLGGILGAVVATAGCVLPSCIIVLILAKIYYKYRNLTLLQGILGGLRPAVVALIGSAGISMIALAFFGTKLNAILWSNLDVVAVGLFAVSLVALRIWKKIDPVFVILGSGLAGMCISFIR